MQERTPIVAGRGDIPKCTKELGWNDVHRILVAVTRYGFIPMKLPIPEC